MPGQTKLSEYIEVMTQIASYADMCHTEDRYNIHAQLECGIGKQYGDPTEMYSLLLKKFKFEQWPYVQYSTDPGNINDCILNNHPYSPRVLINYVKIASGKYKKNVNETSSGASKLALPLISLIILMLY